MLPKNVRKMYCWKEFELQVFSLLFYEVHNLYDYYLTLWREKKTVTQVNSQFWKLFIEQQQHKTDSYVPKLPISLQKCQKILPLRHHVSIFVTSAAILRPLFARWLTLPAHFSEWAHIGEVTVGASAGHYDAGRMGPGHSGSFSLPKWPTWRGHSQQAPSFEIHDWKWRICS